ncbi:5'-methylthioadenosine/S-adenosylhomocysteine nucleosidase [Sphingobacterium sp. SGG-5]|uniref:5'-methylthioadenosine/S-adenosylhomocysteine nucleosidase family protein n=1 Tax=Sphingobacterium sp. SGG-5 TaxID=2710881 RepID=UPI0013EB7AC8|nr:5'-methylthioadenosine/S-adenosylhomocysteine nucleosidase [Sphingobacterium sp. SGG-5]NGM62822.1 5'-methylthioadenosine/S-adenosylhomocysteine nucleosidase [Sphingobacterium sp. SGG-5]
MIRIDHNHSFFLENVLFTFALASEAADIFTAYNHLICGIGKVSATYELMKAIRQERPQLIVNLGSAGSSQFQKGDVVCCTKFIQRDMDVRALGFELYETPLSGIPTLLEYGLHMEALPAAICGTGDNFEMAHAVQHYNIVDMEAYALALVASKENIPFLCLKYISDGADDGAAEDWTVQVHNAANAFAKVLNLPDKNNIQLETTPAKVNIPS